MSQASSTPAETATLIAVITAAIHAAIGNSFTSGLHMALWVAGPILLVGAAVAAVMIRHTTPTAQLARRAEREALAAAETATAEEQPEVSA